MSDNQVGRRIASWMNLAEAVVVAHHRGDQVITIVLRDSHPASGRGVKDG